MTARCALALLLLAPVFSIAPAFAQTGPSESTARERYPQLRARWTAEVNRIADQSQSKGAVEEAEAIRALVASPNTRGISVDILPGRGGARSAAPPGRSEAWSALVRSRKQHAKNLFELASAAFRAGEITVCYDLVCEVIEHDPDHGPARSLLGYTRHRDQWVTPYAAQKLKTGHTWDSRFGWIPRTQLERHENGERPWKGQWLPAEEVAQFRQDWANAWEIETEHYLIRTNAGLERGVGFAEKLEKLYAVFYRLFAGFFSQRDQVALLFDSRNRRPAFGRLDDPPRPVHKRFRVNFYRTAEGYREALRPHVRSGLEGTTGIYVPAARTAYFYVHEEMDEATVIHEATHQLFSESREHRQAVGTEGNYWVIEGIACYMESFEDDGDRVRLGNWNSPRLKIGRDRIMRGASLPIDKLVRLDMDDFQGPAVYALYSQSACVCHFLMHHDAGRYREAFVQYLEAVYLGNAGHQTLAELTGTGYTRLEEEFRAHTEAREE